MLEYSFPQRQAEIDTIRGMTPDQVGKLRDTVKFRMKRLLDTCDEYFDNLIESDCYICGALGHGYFDIPDSWGFINDTLLCNKCIAKWTAKWGPPNINEERGIQYEHSTIPEDSTHRGQADFRLIFNGSGDNREG